MPLNKYLKLTIGDKQVQVSNPEDLPISIDYSLEDPDNFQNKKSAEALSVKVPATLMNDIAGNTYRSPDILDLTNGSVFRSNQPFSIDENGFEIMNGKAFLASATHDSKPKEYEYNLFGDNADWKIDLAETTLYDFLKDITFTFDETNIINSWAFDGIDPALPYVFAPVRYRQPMGGVTVNNNGEAVADDNNMKAEYIRPELSKYWILFNAFKSVGYRIQSSFMDRSYFRRQVMPWTWGNFLDSDGTQLNTHNFLAKSTVGSYYSFPNGRRNFFWNLNVSNDATDGGFDNNTNSANPNGDYIWDASAFEMEWAYNTPDYGTLEATFSMQVQVDAKLNGTTSEIYMAVYWYKNGVKVDASAGGTSDLVTLGGSFFGGNSDVNIKEVFFTGTVIAGDVISAKIYLSGYAAKLGFATISAEVLSFKLDFFKIPLGGTIDFQNYIGFKKYKFLDFFKGIIDEFDISINTDSQNKVVVIEPTEPYSITDDLTDTNPGYFIDDFLDWNGKEDLSKEWKMENYNDYDRELTIKYKPDSNDGILKTIQDRNINTVAAGKYVFPGRFKAGKKDIENRFFSATMHYEVDQWKSITGIAPQMVCLIPENISNTSRDEAANTFVPKSCYYKGLVTGAGGWRFNGMQYTTFPLMFSVNYKPGGENDPILSYSDEKIDDGAGGFVIGKGLLKRFFWQRFAIMRNGQWYNTWFRLKNVDVAGKLHREYKSYRGQRWELIQIRGYKPLQEQSSAVLLKKWAPVSVDDFINTYPSAANVISNNSVDPLDVKYAQLKCLTTDVPTI